MTWRESPPAEIAGRGLFVAALAAFTIATTSTNVMPLLVGALIDGLRLGNDTAGNLVSIELLALAGAALLLAPQMARLSRRRLAVSGAVLVGAAHLASGLPSGLAEIAALRALAGVGEGCVLAAANAVVAGAHDPDRFYAQLTIGGGLVAALLMIALPYPIEAWHHGGAFASMGALVLVGIPLLRSLPPAPRAEERRLGGMRLRWGPIACLLVAAVGTSLGQGALWAFMERLGLRVGLEPGVVGLVLGASSIAILVGAAGAAWLSTSRGRSVPLLSALAATGATCLVIVYTTSPTVYVVAQFVYATFYGFLLPFLLGAAASLDRLGRVTTAVSGASLLAGAAGPALGGALSGGLSYDALGWLVAATSVAAIAALLPALRSLDDGPPAFGDV